MYIIVDKKGHINKVKNVIIIRGGQTGGQQR